MKEWWKILSKRAKSLLFLTAVLLSVHRRRGNFRHIRRRAWAWLRPQNRNRKGNPKSPNNTLVSSLVQSALVRLDPSWIRTWVAAELWRTWRHWYGSHHGWIVSSKWLHKWRRRPTKLRRWSRIKNMRHSCFRSVGKSARNIIRKENDTCVGQ